jgi:Tol biopolymer transport system component
MKSSAVMLVRPSHHLGPKTIITFVALLIPFVAALTRSLASPMTPQSTVALIVFASNRDSSNTQLYAMNLDGSNLVRLTNNNFNDDYPRLSPDGTKILFQSDRDNPENGNYDIYVLNADGSGQTRLTTDAVDDSMAVWSPDGSKIAFQSLRNGPYYQVYVMNADGTNQLNISNGVSVDSQPSWSPDGTKIAFASDRDHTGTPSVYIMNANGSNQTRLTFASEPFKDEQPIWSPDGSRIAFVSTRDSVVETWQETDDEGGILVRTAVRTNKEIYLMNADGSNPVRLTNTLENDDSPNWSPDGTQLVFRSERDRDCCDGTPQLWLMNADGSNQVNLSNNPFGDYGPSWSQNVGNASPPYLGGAGNGNSSPPPQNLVTGDSSSLPVRITFDELPNQTIVANQYQNQYGVKFYSSHFLYPVHTQQNCGPCSTTSPPNFISTLPDVYGQITMEFTQPANNLSFYIIGLDTLSGPYGRVDVYRNGAYSSTSILNGVFNTTAGISFGSTTNITKIVIYGLTDPAGIGIDDVEFTLPVDAKITSARVNGYLNGTTQNALLGADIALNATLTPAGFAGGTYSWAVTPPYQLVTSNNTSSVTIKSTTLGTGTATVSYTKNDVTATGSVTINSILPTLTSFTAQQGRDQVLAPGMCGQTDSFWRYRLGCLRSSSPEDRGIHFSTTVHADPFISDPLQSGIKYVQAVSTFRKRIERGLRCITGRTSQSNVGSGWQVDLDPYAHPPEFPVRRFSEGNDLTILDLDYPSNILTFITDGDFVDSLYIDDRFEMYVVYFTGSNPAQPSIQRPIGRLEWNWGGLVVFEWNGTDTVHTIRSSNAPPTLRTGEPTTSMVTMQGPVTKTDVPCPGGPSLSNNNIDSSRVFVKYHYLDFLERNPAGDATHPPDIGGWNFWTSGISQCVFDLNCIHAKRVATGLAFFYSAEFIGTDPDMANPPGSPNFNPAVYNRRFVFWCYKKYLLRDPDQAGWDFWTSVLNSDGDYAHIIDAFQVSAAYRDRQFP